MVAPWFLLKFLKYYDSDSLLLFTIYQLYSARSSSAQIVVSSWTQNQDSVVRTQNQSALLNVESPVISVKKGWKDFAEFVPLNSQFVCWHIFSSTRFQQVMLCYNFGLFINELIQNGVWKLNIMSMKIFRLSYIHCWGRFSEKSFSSFPSKLILPSSKKLSSNM